MPFVQISGATPTIYRSIPQQEKLLLLTPKQETIFMYLDTIPFHLFPEFIKDILELVEGHQIIDLTDGPGDEKQDILTITSEKKRCLIQCKHTKNRRKKYSGDELDITFSACVRKNCDIAIFITNGDLSAQAKRYINDSEYTKKKVSENKAILIDYWNGHRIWKKIQTSPTILSKWFGDLGHLHGLRNFSFEITLFKLPYFLKEETNIHDHLLTKLLKIGKIEPTERKFVYKGALGNKISFIINRSHQFQSNFNINYLSPEDDKRYVNKPLDSLSIAVTIKSVCTFTPDRIRKKILSYLMNGHLPDITPKTWWHIVSSRIMSFVFIHDIKKTKPIALASSETFIKSTSSNLTEERSFCKLKASNKSIKGVTNDRTPSQHQVKQYFTQRREPFDEFNYSGVQSTQHSFLNTFYSKATGKTNAITQREIVNLLPANWFSFAEDGMLIWFIPKSEKSSVIDSVEESINSLGFQVFNVNQKTGAAVIKNMKMNLPDIIVHDNLEMLRFPIDLTRRKFVISSSFTFNQKTGLNLISELAQFKLSYERHWGHVNTLEKMAYSYRYLTEQLFQPGIQRGERMVDINIWDNPIEIVIQFNKCPIKTSNEIIIEFLAEFKRVESFIKNLFDSLAIKNIS